jgi:hypothetical protein
MAVGSPTQVSLRVCTVNGASIAQAIRNIEVSSSVFAPFNTCRLVLTDTQNISDALYENGVPVRLVYSAGDGKGVREYTFLSSSNMGGTKTSNPVAGGVVLEAVSEEFFNLTSKRHSGAYKGQPGTSIIQKIHNEVSKAPLTTTTSKGLLGQYEDYHIRNRNALDAIRETKSLLTDNRYNSGSYTYFMNNKGEMVLKPLEELMDNADGPMLTQRPLTGAFDSALTFNIMASSKTAGGKGTDSLGAAYKNSVQLGTKADEGYDWGEGKYTPSREQRVRNMSTPGQTTSQYQVSNTSSINHRFSHDTKQNDDGGNKNIDSKAAEKRLRDMAQQGTITAMLPLGGGLQLTVGTGANMKLNGEAGPNMAKASRDGGRTFILASTDYIFMGDSGVQGKTSIQTASGGRTS